MGYIPDAMLIRCKLFGSHKFKLTHNAWHITDGSVFKSEIHTCERCGIQNNRSKLILTQQQLIEAESNRDNPTIKFRKIK